MSRKLSDWLDSFLFFTDNTEPSELFRKWVGISTIASVLQRKCSVRWGEETFFPNMFVVLVGPPASRKGTAMRAGRAFLDQLGITIAADESSKQKLVKSLQETASPSPGSASGKMYYHSSLTIFSRELTVFLGYDNRELLSMLCDWYDCTNLFIHDTFSRGKESVPNVWVNLIGATTPGQLQASLPIIAVSSGFSSRIIFIYQENKGKIVIKPTLSEEQERVRTLLAEDLGDIHTLAGEFSYTGGFDELYTAWREDSEKKKVFSDPRFDYYVQRRPTHLFKLSTIFSASRGRDLTLTRRDLERAISTLHEAEALMPEVFKGVGSNPLARVQLQVLKVIEDRKVVSFGELSQMFFSDATQDQLRDILESLHAMGLCAHDVVSKQVKMLK